MAISAPNSPATPAAFERRDPFFELVEGMLSNAIGDARIWTPRVDVEETDDAWIVEAELPGAKRKDINIEARDGELVISGEIKERERKGVLRRRTRRLGQFEYRVVVPPDVDPGSVEASLDDGILNVRVPKPARPEPRQIEIRGHAEIEAGA
jgi:HSP20 family protein